MLGGESRTTVSSDDRRRRREALKAQAGLRRSPRVRSGGRIVPRADHGVHLHFAGSAAPPSRHAPCQVQGPIHAPVAGASRGRAGSWRIHGLSPPPLLRRVLSVAWRLVARGGPVYAVRSQVGEPPPARVPTALHHPCDHDGRQVGDAQQAIVILLTPGSAPALPSSASSLCSPHRSPPFAV